MKIKEYNQMMSYLTRPKDNLRKIMKRKVDNSNYMVSNGTFKTENQIKEEEVNKDPNILRRIKYYTETYDNAKVGKEFDLAIAQEDENLKKLRGKNIMQRNKPIRPIKKKPTDPVKIDFSGITRDINVYENAIKADPIKPTKREEKLEGLAAILGVDSKKIWKKFFQNNFYKRLDLTLYN